MLEFGPTIRCRCVLAWIVALLFVCAIARAQGESLPELIWPQSEVNGPAIRLPIAPDRPLGPGQSALRGSIGNPSSAVPPYRILRYDEDYSYLQDPSRRTDFWDHLKYIPIGDQPDVFLSLGGETRQWFESYHNDTFGLGPGNAQGYNTYDLQRYLLHADFHAGPRWRVFVQAVSGFENGRIGGPRPDIDVNDFDLHQAFVDTPLPGTDGHAGVVRIGRQEMRYGSGRLIDVREGPNLRRSFDAARILSKIGDWSVDAWWSKPVLNNSGVFDDDPDPAESFWGLYGAGEIVTENRLNLDLCYLGFENKNASFNGQNGYELRHSVGTRIWGRPQPWEFNLEYVYQFGNFGTGNINAWTAANAVRYNFSEALFTPALGVRFDVASGDRNAQSANLQTFNPLFPSGAYFNLAGPFGPLNIIDLHPTLDLHLTETLTISADWNFFWRESLHDGVYRLSGSLIASGQPNEARFIGSSPAVTAVWSPQRHITFLVSYVHVFPGEFIEQATPGKPIDYVTGWLTYKF